MREKIAREEFDNIFVLADFDRTFTFGTTAGTKTPSMTSELEAKGYLDENYSEGAKNLADKYFTVLDNPRATHKEKKNALARWRKEKAQLMIKNGLSKKDLREAVKKSRIKLRTGVIEFLDFLKEKQIPLVVFSGSGTGPVIPMFFENIGRGYDNIHYIINDFKWDDKERAVAPTKPFIHYLNKDDINLDDFPEIYEEIQDRKSVILMGDSIDDIAMIRGFDYRILLTVGFLCYDITDSRRQEFKEKFDVVLEGNDGLGFINEKLFK